MNEIAATTWWMQMTAPPAGETMASLPANCRVLRAEKPTRAFYLYLYTSVGRPYQWYNRLMMQASELQKLLDNEHTEVWVLYDSGVPAGFVEYDLSEANETEIVYFGLSCEFTGRKLGKPFLHWCVQNAWQRPLKRLWLHTCNLDHPAAINLYRGAGFEVYDQDTIMQQTPDPEDDPYLLLPW
ncbi:MAG: GNAT family N-acetyltransferase [Bacteroidales bacterium]|jgi:ribosomal protein S18 acetylase RimI-like enzyme|nr:GNAT family N-acetyltransferase [Bacteroidales bacterium]